MVDFSKIRVGDEVTVRCKVESVHGTGIVATSGSHDQWAVRKDNLATHTPVPRKIKVGDVVTFIDSIYEWNVTAISGQRAWLTYAGSDRVVPLATLKHVD